MIIGVSGRNGAGKGAVIDYLAERSFYVYSLSDVVRSELKRQGVEESRERMIEAGRALRAAAGPGALAEGLLAQLQPDRNYAIDSIRHPEEVEVLRRSPLGAGGPNRRGSNARSPGDQGSANGNVTDRRRAHARVGERSPQ